MIDQLAPVQSDTEAWKASRGGRFTASTIGQLMAEPRTIAPHVIEQYAHLVPADQAWKELKSGPRKGQTVRPDNFNALVREAMREHGIVLFGDIARKLIASKAGERARNVYEYSADTPSTRRGTILEHAARILLSKYWQQVDGSAWTPLDDNSGATPDGNVKRGTETLDFKCPEAFADVLLFDELPDGDFDALEDWDKGYAWQIMTQAKAFGVKWANLVYFTDRLPITPISLVEREEVQAVMDYLANELEERTGRSWHYQFATQGFHFAVKRYELTEERSAKIDAVLASAEKVCVGMVEKINAKRIAA